MSRLVVHLNRSELHDVEPAANAVESSGSFDVELRNHGQPVHVHLRLDEDLSRVASLSDNNYFVEAESVTRVPVAVAEGISATDGSGGSSERRSDGAPAVRGTLTVATGYGSATDHVEVHLSDEADEAEVAVGEDLGRPGTAAEGDPADGGSGGAVPALTWLPLEGSLANQVDARGALALAAVVVVALAAAVTAATAASGPSVVVGILAVLVGLAVAGYLVVRPA